MTDKKDKTVEVAMSRDDIRRATQTRFLENFGTYGTVKRACIETGIHRSTFYDWKEDFEFMARFTQSLQDFVDVIREAAYQRGVVGIQQNVYANGSLVMDANGKPVIVVKHSNALLMCMLRAYVPEYKVQSSENMYPDVQPTITEHSIIVKDIRLLDQKVLDALLANLEEIADREARQVESDLAR